jgi:hypothetical protein
LAVLKVPDTINELGIQVEPIVVAHVAVLAVNHGRSLPFSDFPAFSDTEKDSGDVREAQPAKLLRTRS